MDTTPDPLWEHLSTLRGAVAAHLRGDTDGAVTLVRALAEEADPVELRVLVLSCVCSDLVALADPRGMHPADFAERLAHAAIETLDAPGVEGLLGCAASALLGESDTAVMSLPLDDLAFATSGVAVLAACCAWRAADDGIDPAERANLACLATRPPA